MSTYIIHTDGGARGNPGPAAIGVYIQEENGRVVAKISKQIGHATNNVAEYTAVIEALLWFKDHKLQVSQSPSLSFFLDSTLVVNQLNGLWKIKDGNLRMLLLKIHQLEAEVGGEIRYTSVPREQNTDADFLVNEAFDGQTNK